MKNEHTFAYIHDNCEPLVSVTAKQTALHLSIPITMKSKQ